VGISAITLSTVMGCMSTHVTTEHEPVGGYNENHRCLGIEAEVQTESNFKFGILGSKFKDSLYKDSTMVMAEAIYVFGDPLGLYGGIGLGVGHVHTSYYDGPYAGIIAEIGYDRFSIKATYQPKVPNGDSIIAAQAELTVMRFNSYDWIK